MDICVSVYLLSVYLYIMDNVQRDIYFIYASVLTLLYSYPILSGPFQSSGLLLSHPIIP